MPGPMFLPRGLCPMFLLGGGGDLCRETPEKRAKCILLECFLVTQDSAYFSTNKQPISHMNTTEISDTEKFTFVGTVERWCIN